MYSFNRVFTIGKIALIKTVSNKTGRTIEPSFEAETHEECCNNPDCITSEEKYLPQLFHELQDGRLICKYCSQELKK
jgi:aspartate carbamoyltransferase regulatory subunit